MSIAEQYYLAMGKKNLESLEQFLHPEVKFIGPMAEMVGKDRVLGAAEHFTKLFDSIEIRHTFENGSAEMIVFDLLCPEPIGRFRAATCMEIKDKLITRMELFYDARPFEQKRSEIFDSN